MRIIGLDIHRAFAEAVAWDEGELKRLGRVDMRRPSSRGFRKEAFEGGRGRRRSDRHRILGRRGDRAARKAGRDRKPNAGAHHRSCEDQDRYDRRESPRPALRKRFSARSLIPDEPTQAIRRQVTRRNQIVRQRSRLKNIIQSILDSHSIPSAGTPTCGASGRVWLFHQVLPEDERLAVERHLREFDRLGDDLKVIERVLARSALGTGRRTPDDNPSGRHGGGARRMWPRSATWDASSSRRGFVTATVAGVSFVSKMADGDIVARHQFPPDIIRHAVVPHLRFTLSFRDVADLLAERGLDVSYGNDQTMGVEVGPLFAKELRRRRHRPTSHWHLDKMAVRQPAGASGSGEQSTTKARYSPICWVERRRDKTAAVEN